MSGRRTHQLLPRLTDVFLRTWDLGFTSFGGPPVHFQIFHRRFVDGKGMTPWIDEQTYQELFAICQALPGPASTKMIFNIAHIHAGFLPATLMFLIWSLPGAVGMFGLALGIQRVTKVLPDPVYALLSGLNAATVGIIALAAVQLSRKAITDKLSRALVVFAGSAGLCYSALWYFPVLMVIGGCATVGWDCWMMGKIQRIKARLRRRRRSLESMEVEENSVPMDRTGDRSSTAQQRQISASSIPGTSQQQEIVASPTPLPKHGLSVKWGVVIIVGFLGSFITFMVIRGVLKNEPLPLSLFNNMYLVGTIIFGGGPVVIPLLREYVVEPGWVSPRDFLLGLALIQAFPGPNFNFAVYLGGLTLSHSSTALGAVIGFGIFLPGILLSIGFQSLWTALRRKRSVTSVLRGVNASAVGLVFTAVYRLWQIGYLTPQNSSGVSLANEPWWLVVAVTTYVTVEWYDTPPPVAIIGGGIAGLGWWGVVGRKAL